MPSLMLLMIFCSEIICAAVTASMLRWMVAVCALLPSVSENARKSAITEIRSAIFLF